MGRSYDSHGFFTGDFLIWHLVATKPELREYKAVYVLSDAEIGLFSDEVVVNCAA